MFINAIQVYRAAVRLLWMILVFSASSALAGSEDPSGLPPQCNYDNICTQSPSDNRQEVIIDEKFSVKRGEHVVFEDKIIRMVAKSNDQSIIKIRGSLQIINSVILWEQKYNQQVVLEVGKGGELSIVNSYGRSSGPTWWNWEYAEGASVYLDRANINVWTTAVGRLQYKSTNFSVTRLTLLDVSNSNIDIENSVNVDLELFTPRGSKIDMQVPPSGFYGDWKLSNFFPKTNIDIKQSRIGRVDLTLTNGSDLTLRNYVDGQIGFEIDAGLGNRKECSIDGFGNPENLSGIKVSKQTWNIDCNKSKVTFINSRVVGFWFTMWGVMDLNVSNSRLIDITNAGCGARLTVRQSTIDLVRTRRGKCGQNESAKTFLTNSRVMEGVDVFGEGAKVWLFNTANGGGNEGLHQMDGGSIEVIASDTLPW